MLVILGVLATVAVPRLLDLRGDARDARAMTDPNEIAGALTLASTANYFNNRGTSNGRWVYTCMQAHRFLHVLPGAVRDSAEAPLGGGYTALGSNGGFWVRDHQGNNVEYWALSVQNPAGGDSWNVANEFTTGESRTCIMTSGARSARFTLWGCAAGCS